MVFPKAGAGIMTLAVIPGNPPIQLQLRRSARARRISLKVGRIDGRVTLSMPPRVSEAEALAFAHDKADWIRNVLPKAPPTDLSPQFGGQLSVLGEQLTLTHGATRGVQRLDDLLLVGGRESKLGPLLAAYLRVTAHGALIEATTRYAHQIGCTFTGLALRDTKSRWGSCSPDGKLMFSWRLAMAPLAVLDYVAAHEVAHLAEMNHGPRFWALVRQICPEFSRHRAWLKRDGGHLQLIDFAARSDG
jgi:predicted metal-dependent hydrolase